MYTEHFKKFVSQGIEQKAYIGIGNPNSNILLVGKEAAIDPNNQEALENYKNDALKWQELIEAGQEQVYHYPIDEGSPLYKSWGKNTWSKYQQLISAVRERQAKPYFVDFLSSCFTTEINDAPMLRTADANKEGLQNRKKFFQESSFIQEFPVVILACSNYIQNNEQVREIDEIFGVSYAGDEIGKHQYNQGNWFYLHYSPDKRKLVIHTRQLSADVKNEMLQDMGRIIRQHLIDITIG